jgi:DNA-binding GntR family transcriptional regulator
MSALMTATRDQLQNRKTLPDLVAAELRERINSGSLPMGAALNQFALTQELRVSRTVVREAFRQLEAAGMIRLTPYRHAIVIPLSCNDLDDLLEIRTTLECLAAGRAVHRMDADARATHRARGDHGARDR